MTGLLILITKRKLTATPLSGDKKKYVWNTIAPTDLHLLWSLLKIKINTKLQQPHPIRINNDPDFLPLKACAAHQVKIRGQLLFFLKVQNMQNESQKKLVIMTSHNHVTSYRNENCNCVSTLFHEYAGTCVYHIHVI